MNILSPALRWYYKQYEAMRAFFEEQQTGFGSSRTVRLYGFGGVWLKRDFRRHLKSNPKPITFSPLYPIYRPAQKRPVQPEQAIIALRKHIIRLLRSHRRIPKVQNQLQLCLRAAYPRAALPGCPAEPVGQPPGIKRRVWKRLAAISAACRRAF